MKYIQITKKLNNTELGKGGTHETYVHIPQDLNINDLFPTLGMVEKFVDKKNGKIYEIRYTKGREKRIVGLGEIYREKNVCAGDEIVLERQVDNDGVSKLYIDLLKKDNNILMQRCKSGFEILTNNNAQSILSDVSVYSSGEIKSINIEFLEKVKKRKDSPTETDIFEIKIDGTNIAKEYSSKDMIEIKVDKINKIAFIYKTNMWEKYIFETEEQDD